MSTVINTNIAATRTSNIYNKNNANMNTYLSRVATGQKINSVKDNASQWAISEKMRERMNSLSQAHQNTQNDNALLKTAEGGISNTVDILRTLKARAINAADGTLQNSDRALIQKEVDGLIEQINDNANKVTYNGIKLLDGSASGSGTAATTAVQGIAFATDNATDASKLEDSDVWSQDGTSAKPIVLNWKNAAGTATATSIGSFDKDTTVSALVTAINNKLDAENSGAGTGFNVAFYAKDATITGDVTAPNAGIYAVASDSGADNNFTFVSLTVDGTAKGTVKDVQAGANASSGALDFQVGDDDSFRISANLPNMKAATLGIGSIDVSTASGAMSAMGLLDTALTTALSAAADVGALEQRLGYTADNLTTMNENLEASDSAIRDSDIAKDMTNYMKYAVLSQASQYMLAQAGQNAFSVLNLLQA